MLTNRYDSAVLHSKLPGFNSLNVGKIYKEVVVAAEKLPAVQYPFQIGKTHAAFQRETVLPSDASAVMGSH